MKNIFLLVSAFVWFSSVSAQSQRPLIFSPSISPDGQNIAFSYQGDIWIADIDGTGSRRLTIHEGYETAPLWTTDGTEIVFKSDRNGNNDVFVMPVQGGLPRQLTYYSGGDTPTDVTKDGKVLFNTYRVFNQIERYGEVYQTSLTETTPSRLLSALGSDAVQSPNGRYVAFVIGVCRDAREAYDGSANNDIWLYDSQNDVYSQLTTNTINDLYPHWGDDETLYFQSSRAGRYNIHKISLDKEGKPSGDIVPVTTFTDMGITSYQVGNQGKTLIAVKGDQVYTIDAATNALTEVNISLGADFRFDPTEQKSYSGDVSQLVPSPSGKYSALLIRGEIFITENDEEKGKTVNVSNSSYRDIEPQWVNDSTLIFLSDRAGQYDMYAVSSSDPKISNLMKSLKREVVKVAKANNSISNTQMSPDGKSIAFVRDEGQLVVAAISAKGFISNEQVLAEGWASFDGITWSPDGQWLAYSQADLNFNDEVFIHKVDNSMAPVNVSMHPKADGYPVWSADGSKLVFASARSNSDYDIWFVWLTKKDWEKTADEWKYDDEEDKQAPKKSTNDSKKKKNTKDDKSNKEVEKIQIDLEDIHERLVQVTSFTGNEVAPMVSKDGKTIYYRTSGLGWGKPAKVDYDLFKINWDGKDHKAVTKGSTRPYNTSMDTKMEYIYLLTKGGKPNRIKLSNDKKTGLPISAKLTINYQEEYNQIFEEAWSALNQKFYDPEFHGQDFVALKNTYKPLVMKASTREDFNFVFNQMLGQLNASHMGLYRGDMRKDLKKTKTGLLGLEIVPVSEGVKVTRKLPSMPADRQISMINVGESITAVNGVQINDDINFNRLMNGTVGERILLTVKNTAGQKREVEIRPVSSNRNATYKAWVKEKQRLVKEYSNGQLGYIHIQAMGWGSFERFERELSAAGYGKKGIVIDVRYNGGGWTTDHLMAILNVKQHAYTIPRGATKSLKDNKQFADYYPYSERLPLPAWTKPSIALCNESSYSNAEIFSHAYKQLGVGTLVGQPTFGAVISTGGKGLIDGSFVRLPFRAWYVKATGENMEWEPAVPDILLKNSPDEKSKNQDSQLKRAVKELMNQL